jgi:hypothetical protein
LFEEYLPLNIYYNLELNVFWIFSLLEYLLRSLRLKIFGFYGEPLNLFEDNDYKVT